MVGAGRQTLAVLQGRLLVLGFGSVGQGVLPLLLRHLGVARERVTIVKPPGRGDAEAQALGVRCIHATLTPENYRQTLAPLLEPGDFLLNASVNVCSVDVLRLCWERGAMYLDACNEPWHGRAYDHSLPAAQRTNYALREQALALRRDGAGRPTACISQGANPGVVSAFVKQALQDVAAATGLAFDRRQGHAALAQALGIKVIHVAERDTQASPQRKRVGEFVNTWSVEGFAEEGTQPSELGWGTHERHWPRDAHAHDHGTRAAIYLDRCGFATRVRSWTPLQGPYHGLLVTHGESISIPDHLTVRDGERVVYRPTVHYAYHPCDDALLSVHELAGRNWRLQERQRILRDEITSGRDELGVLLMGHPRGAYWYGSRLSIGEARELAPLNSATTLQVAAGILGAMVWALQNPNAGLVEADDIDHEVLLGAARAYLGEVVGVWTDWTPLSDRSALFGEEMDPSDPWQFVNFRVS